MSNKIMLLLFIGIIGGFFAGLSVIVHGIFSLADFDYKCWEMDIFVKCGMWGTLKWAAIDIIKIIFGISTWVLVFLGIVHLNSAIDSTDITTEENQES